MSTELASPPENPTLTLDEWSKSARESEPQWDACIRSVYQPEVKAADDIERGLWYTISTTSQDRDGDVIYPKHSNWNGFLKGGNGPVLWAHDYRSFPLGASPDVRVSDKSIKALAQFFTKDELGLSSTDSSLSEMAYRVSQKYRGVLSTSIGFIPDPENSKFDKDLGARGGFRFRGAWEGLEFSIVPVPSNRDAVQMMASDGIDLRPLRAWAEKALALSDASAVDNEKLEALALSIGRKDGLSFYDLGADNFKAAIVSTGNAPSRDQKAELEVDVSAKGAEALQKVAESFAETASSITDRLDALEARLPESKEDQPKTFQWPDAEAIQRAVERGCQSTLDEISLSRTGALPD